MSTTSLVMFIVALSGCVGSRSGPVVPDMVYELELDATQLRIAFPSAGLSGRYPPPKPPGRYALSSSERRIAEGHRARQMLKGFYDFGGRFRLNDGTFSISVVAVGIAGDGAPEGPEGYIDFLRQRLSTIQRGDYDASEIELAGDTWFRFSNWPDGSRSVIRDSTDTREIYVFPVNEDAMILISFRFYGGGSRTKDEDWMARAFPIADAILASIEVDQ